MFRMEEFLLNPNVAYLLLMAGLLLAAMALVSPGTGLLEVGALFALILAGWAMYQLPISYWALLILLVGTGAFWLALRRPRRLLWLAAALVALVIGSAFLFNGEGWLPAVHPLLAVVVSALMCGFLWVAVIKSYEASRVVPEHDLSRLIGAIGEAKSEIHTEGTVQVGGELWTAHSAQLIPGGAEVRVVNREGLTLEVEPVEAATS
jgi:membrane-bound serine protease (ClpP class)